MRRSEEKQSVQTKASGIMYDLWMEKKAGSSVPMSVTFMMALELRFHSKPTISYNDQLQHLEQMGLIIKNKSKALKYLETVGYYRLREDVRPTR